MKLCAMSWKHYYMLASLAWTNIIVISGVTSTLSMSTASTSSQTLQPVTLTATIRTLPDVMVTSIVRHQESSSPLVVLSSKSSGVVQTQSSSVVITNIYQSVPVTVSNFSDIIKPSLVESTMTPVTPSIQYFSPRITSLALFVTGNVSTATGISLVLVCTAEGHPRPTISWAKLPNGTFDHSLIVNKNVSSTQAKSTLVINPVFITDTGNYTCLASNKYGVSNSTRPFTVYGAAQIIEFYPHIEKNKDNASSFKIACGAVGNPRPNITWLKSFSESFEYTSIKTEPVMEIGIRSLLVIKNYTLSNAGIYICKAANEHGIATRNISFVVHTFPSVAVLKHNLVVDIYSPVQLSCLFSGFPKPRVTWYKNGRKLILTGKWYYDAVIFQHPTQLQYQWINYLQFFTSSMNDSGQYQCVAENPVGTAVSSATVLQIRGLLEIIVSVQPPTPEAGTRVLMVCQGGELHNDLVYSWQKYNQSIQLDDARYNISKNGSRLSISSVNIEDEGLYRCVAMTRYNHSVLSEFITLDVWYFNATTSHMDHTMYEGSQLKVLCTANGKPTPEVSWIKTTKNDIVSKTGTLMINNATIGNNGSYICIGNNSFKTVYLIILDVTVKAFPTLSIMSSTKEVSIVRGHFLIECTSNDKAGLMRLGYLEWLKDGVYINLTNQSIHFERWSPSLLLVKNPGVEHSGRYQCEGKIGQLSKRSPFVEIVVYVPSGPVVLQQKPESSVTGILLSWTPIDKAFWNGAKIIYKTSVYLSNILVKVLVGPESQVTISGLKAETNYTIIISGSTKYGVVPPLSFNIKTKPNKNIKGFETKIRFTEMDFTEDLRNPSSETYSTLTRDLQSSIDRIFKESTLRYYFIESQVTGYSEGSVVAHTTISLANEFTLSPELLVQTINNEDTIGKFKFQKSFTAVSDFNECKERKFHSCHQYANCSNIVGSYVCTCRKGFFGDGTSCTGPPQIITRSPINVTQLVETNVTLLCGVMADPLPEIKWIKRSNNGVENIVNIKKQTNIGDLNIRAAEIADSGLYMCNVTNQLGRDSYHTRLTIKPVVVDIDVELKLANKTFKKELENKTSLEYKVLEHEVYTGLFDFFNKTPGFKDVEIIGFVKGSVKVLFRVIFNIEKPSENPKSVVAVKVGRKLNKESKKGRIGNIKVLPQVIKIREAPPPPVNIVYSDIKENSVHINWDHPELHEMFSIEHYTIAYRKYGNNEWKNKTVDAELSTNTPLRNLQSDSFYDVYIIARNAFGNSKKTDTKEVKTSKVEVLSPWLYIAPIICVVVIILIVLIAWILRRVTRSGRLNLITKKKRVEKDPAKESTCFKNEMFSMSDMKNSENVYENDIFLEADEKINWNEISRTSIELQQEDLNKGEFGFILVEGKIISPSNANPTICSVKMSKDPVDEKAADDLMAELYKISSISFHKNIVNLIGACTFGQKSPLLLLEICQNGTLQDYLRKNSEGTYMNENSKTDLSSRNKLKLALDVAQGMNHLTKYRIVHRNLASRNVLLDNNHTAKVTNFGYARDIYEQGRYVNPKKSNLSTRWMALESILDGLFTLESDVWSFGVVMWEIETEACLPFGELEETSIADHLRNGNRLKQPEKCRSDIFQLMSKCWEATPSKRPTFDEIISTLENLFV